MPARQTAYAPTAQHAPQRAPQRAVGRLRLGFGRDAAAARTRIGTLYQEGCLKARLPRPASFGTCEAVIMNIGGGIAGGDALATSITLGPGAQACVASQAAERVYRALDGTEPACIATGITLGPGASLAHLPQETILFDGFALRRSLDIELAEDAEYLGVESLVFGRQAMGETVRHGTLRDRISLRRDGALLLRDMTRLDGDIAAQLRRKAVAAGNIAMASIIHAAPDAPSRVDALRAALQDYEAGVSAVRNIVLIRIIAPSAHSLRHCAMAALNICRDGLPLPRVWQG